MAKIEIPAAASGAASDASTPVCSNGIGPGTTSARKPSSTVVSGGTASSGHTIDSSSGVRVIETKPSCSSSAHDGIAVRGARRRQTARVSGRTAISMERQNARPDAARRRADRVAGRHRRVARGRRGARGVVAPGGRTGGDRPRGAGARAAHVRRDRVRVGGQRAPRGAGAPSPTTRPRAVIYSTTTAALLGPVPGAIRFDAPAAGNAPGRHGIWQRPVEARRFARRRCSCRGARGAWPRRRRRTPTRSSCRCRSRPRGRRAAQRDIAAITYGANPEKKGLDTVLAAWRGASGSSRGRTRRTRARVGRPRSAPRRAGRARGVRALLPRDEYRALLRRSRVFRHRAAARGLRDRAARGARGRVHARHHARARPVRRAADRARARPAARGRRVSRSATALDDPAPGYAERAAAALSRSRRRRSTASSPSELLPRLIS